MTTGDVPESAAMRSLLASGQTHGVLAFLFALVVTNGSQSMMSGTNVSENRGEWVTTGAWVATALVVGGAVMVGYWYVADLPNFWLGELRSFAGRAVLTSLAAEIYSDAALLKSYFLDTM